MEIGSSPEKSRFSLAYNLWGQYTEKDCPTDLALGMPSLSRVTNRIEGYRPPATMRLLTGADVSVDHHAEEDESASRRVERAQLTIFFGGKMVVFDDFPADKAMGLMQLASKSSKTLSLVTPPSSVSVPDRVSCLAPTNPPATVQHRPEPNFSDLPIARKASLHRFLEKRKDRISAKAPYRVSNGDGSMGKAFAIKQEEIAGSKPWLGLGPQMSDAGRNSDYTR